MFKRLSICAGYGYMKTSDFEQVWPSENKEVQIDFNSNEYKEWYKNMKIQNNIK